MANPSLQIGSGNWAIKADELLGYRVVGNKYFPVPIDVSRATAATRVDEAGLVDYAEILGGEEVTNGDFTDGVEGVVGGNFESGLIGTVGNAGGTVYSWALNTVAPISGTQDGLLSITSVGTNASHPRLKFDGNLSLDKSFVLTFDYKVNSGTCKFSSINRGGGTSLNFPTVTLTGSGTYTLYFQGTGTGLLTINFNGTNLFDTQFDNISIKELGQDWILGPGWSIGDDKAICTANGGFDVLNQLSVLNSGSSYKVTYTADLSLITSGSLKLNIFSNSVSERTVLDGTNTVYLTANGASFQVNEGGAVGTATITDISVEEVGELKVDIGGAPVQSITASGTHSLTFTAVDSDPFRIYGSTFTGSVTNIFVTQVAGGTLERWWRVNGNIDTLTDPAPNVASNGISNDLNWSNNPPVQPDTP